MSAGLCCLSMCVWWQNVKVRITKYRVDGKEVAGTYSSAEKVCNWGNITRSCEEGFNKVIEERCY